MREAKVGRKEREYQLHRQEILAAAERVFAQKGFFHSRMSEIADAAEFGTGTLYKYFDSKEELYFTLINEKTEGINRFICSELLRNAPPVEKIERALQLQLEFIERNRDFFKIYTTERSRFPWTFKDELGKTMHRRMVRYLHVLAEVMQEGTRKRIFKPLNPMDMAQALVGIVNSYVFEWLMSPQPYSLTAKKDVILEIFWRGARKT